MTSNLRPDPAWSRRGRVSFGRIVADAARTLRSRPGRTVGLGLAVALGVGTAVGILSISDAANAQARARIDAYRPEMVRVRPLEPSPQLVEDLPDTAVVAAGRDWRVQAVAAVQTIPARAVMARLTPTDQAPQQAAIAAVDGDIAAATRTVVDGRTFHPGEEAAGARVVIVGSRIANTLGLAPVTSAPTIWIDGIAFRVVGIALSSEHHGSVTEQVLVPRATAITYFGDQQEYVDTVVYVRTGRGNATAAATDLPSWMSPERPERWTTEVPRSSLDLASEISQDLRNLTLAMAGVVLFVGIVAIANAMTRAVYERIPEIGLRRTLGARSEQILTLLLAEAGLIGMVAGILGVAIGSAVAIAVAAHNSWPVTLSGPAIALAVPAAFLSGVLGGILPSTAAVRVTPSQALRRE